MKNRNYKIVYSSDPKVERDDDSISEENKIELKNQTLRICLDRKQRAGKSVTLIEGFTGWPDEKIEGLARTLKSQCATGGTVKNRIIEIQGDQRNKIDMILVKMGYKTQGIN